MKKPPKWTVVCNLVSPESDSWVGTSWEFFDSEESASKCYQRHVNARDCPTKRFYFDREDRQHIGIADRLNTEAVEFPFDPDTIREKYPNEKGPQ